MKEKIENLMQEAEMNLKDIYYKYDKIEEENSIKVLKAFKENNLDADEMTINELLDFIVENPSVLRRPIIVDKHRLQVGYNDEEIRCFLPRELRNVIYCKNCDNCNCSYVNALERALSDNFIENTSKRN